MEYLLCFPDKETNTRENCEKIHNVLARMSDTYKLRIVPEPMKNKQFQSPPYCKKYRIYKQVKERDANGEAYLEKEEEDMILNSCKTEEEQELMKNCIYAYQYSASLVLKSFREKEKKNKMQGRLISDKAPATVTADSAMVQAQSVKTEDNVPDSDAKEREIQEKNVRERDFRERDTRERDTRERYKRERGHREEDAAKRDVKEREVRERGLREGEFQKKDMRERRARGRGAKDAENREKSTRERIVPEEIRERKMKERVVPNNKPKMSAKEDNVQPFRTRIETGSLPEFRGAASPVTAQPMQRKKEGYTPMERKPALQPQANDAKNQF